MINIEKEGEKKERLKFMSEKFIPSNLGGVKIHVAILKFSAFRGGVNLVATMENLRNSVVARSRSNHVHVLTRAPDI